MPAVSAICELVVENQHFLRDGGQIEEQDTVEGGHGAPSLQHLGEGFRFELFQQLLCQYGHSHSHQNIQAFCWAGSTSGVWIKDSCAFQYGDWTLVET